LKKAACSSAYQLDFDQALKAVVMEEAAMPLVTIETRKGLDGSQKAALFDAVHAALVSAFRIPGSDRNQRLIEYDAADFESQGKGERFTIVTIDAFAGRSIDAKRLLYREMAANLERVGVPPGDLVVVVHDVALGNWGIRGGQAAADVELGFEVDV
jgi:phenylpyruvate tautomerase PptA (4-oxalocrotonate tautomerase family)